MLNSYLNIAQFWDGRAADLKERAGGPIANPGDIAFSHTLAVALLEATPGYVVAFKQIFGIDKINIDEALQPIAQ